MQRANIWDEVCYELAMERLEAQAPSAKLTPEQKTEIAELDSACTAKVAEKEVFLRDQINKALAQGDLEQVALIEQQLTREVRRLREDTEAKKDQVRHQQ